MIFLKKGWFRILRILRKSRKLRKLFKVSSGGAKEFITAEMQARKGKNGIRV
jgi:hypothetical protein